MSLDIRDDYSANWRSLKTAKSLTIFPHRPDQISSSTDKDVVAPQVAGFGREVVLEQPIPSAVAADSVAEVDANRHMSIRDRVDADFVTRILSLFWLAGCLTLALKLLVSVMVLRRRLSACRPVTDAGILDLLESARRRIGLRSSPLLLVTPECLSPCIVGTWRPAIVLPESIVTESKTAQLRHVLAHELAHLVRGDLWTNWLLLAARILHWFNPVAWWTVRAMQAEREAACDELAFAALGEVDRSAYAATIVELAASLSPSAIAPGLIGLFSSTDRLKSASNALCVSLQPQPSAPIAAGLFIGMALLGLTDSMPGAEAQAPPKVAGRKALLLTPAPSTENALTMPPTLRQLAFRCGCTRLKDGLPLQPRLPGQSRMPTVVSHSQVSYRPVQKATLIARTTGFSASPPIGGSVAALSIFKKTKRSLLFG